MATKPPPPGLFPTIQQWAKDVSKAPGGYKVKPKGGGKGGPPVLPPPKVTAPVKKGSHPTGERAMFNKFMQAHPSMRKYSTVIWNAVHDYGGITPTQLAAVLYVQSGGAGLNRQAVRGAAFQLGQYAAATGSNDIDAIWRAVYSPSGSFPRNYISRNLPKGYPAAVVAGETPKEQVQQSVYKSQLRAALLGKNVNDPFVIGINNKGFVTSFNAKKSIMYDGQALRLSDVQGVRNSIESLYVSYTGGRPSNRQVFQYIQKGWSPYTLTVALSKGKNFTKSPIWKSQAPAYRDAAKELLAPGETMPTNLVRSAIINNWSQQTFQSVLRAQPNYIKSNEFKGNTATMLNVHQSIMGVPNKGSLNSIKQATLAGWQPDQYAAWLRSQPQYVQSPEYQTKALSFLSALGLITGEQAVLEKGHVNPKQNPNPAGFGPLPKDKRLPVGKLSNEEDTMATFNG